MRNGLLSVLCLLIAVAAQAETNSEVLNKVWAVGRQNACSPEMRGQFNDTTLARLKSQLKDETERKALASVLNPFLFSMGYSHTEFFTDQMEAYYVFKGYQAIIDPSAPAAPLMVNPGIQVGTDDYGYFAREVLDGSPAMAQGLSKGDRILSVDGKPFTGFFGYEPKSKAIVRIAHQGTFKEITVDLPAVNWAQALEDATLNSVHVLSHAGRSIGYVRLWSGVHPESAQALWAAVNKLKAQKTDGLVLDLRGGYGGAFWEHLDPFFADRKDFFVMNAKDGNNQIEIRAPEPQDNPGAYLGPMAVLINEGSRSGKEAMAYQFKKSKRATLIGTTTAGYFSGGGMFFMDQPSDYMLYLCVMRDSTLDGVSIEGVGVKPDLNIGYEASGPYQDSQLNTALESLAR